MGILRIRLQRFGRRGAPFYRVVVADSKSPRDGKFIELVGTYDPIANKAGIKEVTFKVEKIRYWMGVGAKPSDRVAWLLGQFGIIPPPPVPVAITKRHLKKNPDKKTKRELRELKGESFHTSAFSAASTALAPDVIELGLGTVKSLELPVEWGTGNSAAVAADEAGELWGMYQDTSFELAIGARLQDNGELKGDAKGDRPSMAAVAAAATVFALSKRPFFLPANNGSVASLAQELGATSFLEQGRREGAAAGLERRGAMGEGLGEVLDGVLNQSDVVLSEVARAPHTPLWLWPGFDEYACATGSFGASTEL